MTYCPVVYHPSVHSWPARSIVAENAPMLPLPRLHPISILISFCDPAGDKWLHFLSCPRSKWHLVHSLWRNKLVTCQENQRGWWAVLLFKRGCLIFSPRVNRKTHEQSRPHKASQANWIWVMTHPVTADRDVQWAAGTLADWGNLKQDWVVETKLDYSIQFAIAQTLPAAKCFWGAVELMLCRLIRRSNDATDF